MIIYYEKRRELRWEKWMRCWKLNPSTSNESYYWMRWAIDGENKEKVKFVAINQACRYSCVTTITSIEVSMCVTKWFSDEKMISSYFIKNRKISPEKMVRISFVSMLSMILTLLFIGKFKYKSSVNSTFKNKKLFNHMEKIWRYSY